MEIKQSNDFIQRNIYVYQNCIYPWDGVFIHSVIRVDKIVNCKETKTHYYISNDTDSAESFLQKILQELAYSNTKQSLINPYSNLTIEKSIKASAKF